MRSFAGKVVLEFVEQVTKPSHTPIVNGLARHLKNQAFY